MDPFVARRDKREYGTLKLLLDNGADVNATTDMGASAAKLLLDAGIDLTLKDLDGKTALDITIQMKNKAILEILANHNENGKLATNLPENRDGNVTV